MSNPLLKQQDSQITRSRMKRVELVHRGKDTCQTRIRCSLYQIHRNDCTMHYINTESLKTLILDTIREATAYARENKTQFVKIIREASAVRLSEKRFTQLSGSYESEQEILETQTANLRTELAQFESDRNNGNSKSTKRRAWSIESQGGGSVFTYFAALF